MSETWTIKHLVRRYPGTGWKPYHYWAAVGDDTGEEESRFRAQDAEVVGCG